VRLRARPTVAGSIGLCQLLESSEEKTIHIPIFVSSANTIGQGLKLCAHKRELIVVNTKIKPIMVPVFIPLVLVGDDRNISVTTILKVQRGKLGLFANKCTINKTFYLQRLVMNNMDSDNVCRGRTHRHCLSGPHINTKSKNGIRGEVMKTHPETPKNGDDSSVERKMKSSSK
jgi:hypothetical protein